MKKYNIGISIVLILMSVAMFLSASKMPSVDGGMGAGTWPKVLGGLHDPVGRPPAVQSLQTAPRKSALTMGPGLKRVLTGIAIMLVFCVILNFFGFMIASAFMIPAIMILMGERRPFMLIGVTVGVLVFIYVVFAILLNLPLPSGSVL